MLKNTVLIIGSVVFAVALVAGLFEGIASYRYDSWKAKFEEKGGLYGKLTIGSDNKVLMWQYRPNAVGETRGPRLRPTNMAFGMTAGDTTNVLAICVSHSQATP